MRHQRTRTHLTADAKLAGRAVCLALLLVACGSTAFAQEAEGPLRAAVRRVEAPLDGGLEKGPQPPARQTPAWIVRHPVFTGTIAGAGAGLALSHVDAIGGASHDPRVALIGAGAGAWGGLIASAVHKSRNGEKVGAGTKIGLVTGAVVLIALPVLACYGAGGCGGSS